MSVTITCSECCEDFVVHWEWDPTVTCPCCGAVLKVEYDEDDDGLIGPWVVDVVEG